MPASVLIQATITSQLVLCFSLGPCNSSLKWPPEQAHPSVSQVPSLLCSEFPNAPASRTHPHSDPYVTMCPGLLLFNFISCCSAFTHLPGQLQPWHGLLPFLGAVIGWLPLFRSLVRRSALITLFKTSQSPQTFTTIYIKCLSCLLSVSPLRM